MSKKILRLTAISVCITCIVAALVGCAPGTNYSEYVLTGTWESAREDDQFSESPSTTSTRTSSGSRAVRTAPSSNPGTSESLPSAIIVRFDQDIERTRALPSDIGKYGTEVPRTRHAAFAFSRIEIHSGEATPIEDIISYYENLPGVKYVEEDHIVSTQAVITVNDPYYYTRQWNFQQLGMTEAWGITEGKSSITAAILDTGIAQDISDLAGTRFTTGWNYVDDNENTYDDNGHGTHVSGTVAQTTHNAHGTAGMAYGITLMPIKVLGSDGTGYSSDIAAGIIRAADNGADIINMSLAAEGFNLTTYDALAYAYQQKGVTIFASSGNDDADSVSYPAAYDEYVIAVGATDRKQERAYYSNYGSTLDVMAPGGDTSTTAEDGILQQSVYGGTEEFYYSSGTSMAAPHATALGALLLSRNPGLTPAEVKAAITRTADDLGDAGKDVYYGYGLINPVAALESVSEGSIITYEVTDSVQDTYTDAEKPYVQWYFRADAGEIHLSLYDPSSDITITLYDNEGVVIASTEGTEKQEIRYPVGTDGGEFSVFIH